MANVGTSRVTWWKPLTAVVLAACFVGCPIPADAGCAGKAIEQDAVIAVDGVLSPHDWVKTDQVIYVALGGRGVFRARLNSNVLEPLATHLNFYSFDLSTSARYLLYETGKGPRDGAFIYDLHLGIEQQLFGLQMYERNAISPDNEWLAGSSPHDEAPSVSLINLNTGRRHVVLLPSAGETASLKDIVWSTDNHLFFRVFDGGAYAAWRLDPKTKALTKIRAVAGRSQVTYFEGPAAVASFCSFCAPVFLTNAPVAGGFVSATYRSLILHRQGAPGRVILAVPPEPPVPPGRPVLPCGPDGIHLYAVFDGNYVLFSNDHLFEIYGVRENRIAILPIPSTFEGIVWPPAR